MRIVQRLDQRVGRRFRCGRASQLQQHAWQRKVVGDDAAVVLRARFDPRAAGDRDAIAVVDCAMDQRRGGGHGGTDGPRGGR
jgi:hypothetical protein